LVVDFGRVGDAEAEYREALELRTTQHRGPPAQRERLAPPGGLSIVSPVDRAHLR
jgi:hypothetical protein